MKDYWIITERTSADSFLSNGFKCKDEFHNMASDKIHIHLRSKRLFTYYDLEGVDSYDIYIKDFDINKYNQLALLVSLGIPIEEAFKELAE